MKRLVLLFLMLFSQVSPAQNTVNQYQYVIVPSKFDFTNGKDEFRLNTLTKLLLEKYGFKAFLDTDPFPTGIEDPKCDILYAKVESSGNFMLTKLRVVLSDCKDKVLYESGVGKNKEKDLKVSYTLALREAFQSFENLHYKYTPAVKNEPTSKTTTVLPTESLPDKSSELLYAQALPNGYQLIDTTPKIVMKLFKTSNPAAFSAVKGSVQGMLVSKDNQWYFEYYVAEKLISEKVNVKF